MAKEDYFHVAGVDEAGRGPLAGPVVAAAVILDWHVSIPGLQDSKLLSPKKREALFVLIKKHALCWAAAQANVMEIDQLNILQASLVAMQRAVKKLAVVPHEVRVDGNHCPRFDCRSRAIIRGDQTEPAISAASIVAKVMRDRLMRLFDKRHPEYGFAQHKGYGTAFHLAALKKFGPIALHRRSFAPVAECHAAEEVGLEEAIE